MTQVTSVSSISLTYRFRTERVDHGDAAAVQRVSFADLHTAVHHTVDSAKRKRRRALLRLLLMLRL